MISKNQIWKIYGTAFKDMTKELLAKTELADLIGDRKASVAIKPTASIGKPQATVDYSAMTNEVLQSAKYVPYLEIVFGEDYEIIPVLVLTAAREMFRYVSIGQKDAVLPVCSGDMIFTAFDEYLGFLAR